VKLGERLLESGAIDRDGLLAGLREQALVGGRIGGRLVALGKIDHGGLAKVLAAATGVAPATERSTEEARAKIDEESARRERALPLTITEGKLVCAMADPGDARAIKVLGRVAGMTVEPRVAGEDWITGEIDRHYAPAQLHAASEAGAVHGARAANRMTRPIRMGQVAPPHLRPQPIAAVDGQKLLDAAVAREQLGGAMVGFSVSRLDSSILFAVRGGKLVGWRGQGPGIDEETLAQITLREEDGALVTEALAGRTFKGRHNLPLSLTTLGALQGPKGEMVSVPCALEGRVIAVMVGTTRGPADGAMVRALEANAAAAAVAWQRVLDAMTLEPQSA
jgi:limonene-1,2-epoxide hydrolase